jgi:hypothetical protein
MPCICVLAIILVLSPASAPDRSQQSSSQTTRSANPAAKATPTPESRKRRFIPEVEEAMDKGQELLFKKHDA